MDVEITELEKIEADRVDGVGSPANGIPILMMKQVGDGDVAKDWTQWDAAHEGGGKGKPSAAGDSKASAADAVARAKQTIADHRAGKKVSAADLKNAHEVHEAHLAHEAKLKAAAKPKAKTPKAAKELAKMIIAAPHADPALLLKAVGDDGEVDEEPDVEGGTRVLEMIADLIIAEAQELKAGQAGEIADIFELCCAAEKIWCWRTGEQAVSSGSVMPATALMQSAAGWEAAMEKTLQGSGYELVKCDEEREGVPYKLTKADMSTASINDLPDSAFAYIEDGGEKDSDGKTTPRSKRHFPVHDKAHAANALSRAPQSPFGDKAMPKIKAAAKKFGIGDDTAKSQIAKEDATVDNDTQTGGLAKAVEEAVAKATGPLEERIKTLSEDLAKVKATPVPGGLVLSRNVQVKQPGAVVNEDHAAKAAYYREMAETVTDRPTADGYRKLAREADAKAVTPTS